MRMTAGVIAAAPKLQARVIKVEGLVAAVDGGQIEVERRRENRHQGWRPACAVERITSTIKDPATGAVLRKMTTKLGELEVSLIVDDISAVCKLSLGQRV